MNLFNKKFIGKQIAVLPAPDDARLAAFRDWAASIASGRVASLSEVQLHGPFMELMIRGLGYRGPVGDGDYTVTQEESVVRGAVDLAIGQFGDDQRQIVAPFELKGADTRNLDAIMPSRAKTPVDQVWEYATKNPGTRWVRWSRKFGQDAKLLPT